MLRRIVEFSLRAPGVILIASLLLAAYGLFIAQSVPLDVFPEFSPPRIVIQTEAPGLTPEEVEALVTRPVEYALNGTPELEHLYSQSIQGLSVVTLVFRESADIFRVRQLTSERLTQLAGNLPQGVHPPQMGALTSSTSLMMTLGLVSQERTPMELRTLADWVVRLRLLGVPGVARVEVFGGEVRQLQIQFHPDRLLAYHLSLEEVIAAAREATGIRGAGFIENDNQRVTLRTEGQSVTPEALGRTVLLHKNGFTVRLQDVASVVEGPEPKIGDGLVNGKPGVVLMVHSQYGANTLEVTRRVEAVLGQLKPLLAAQHVKLVPALFRPANFIEASIHNIDHALLIGGVLVIIVLFAFLANLRSAFIAFITIPLSLLAAIIVLNAMGASLNTITLGGFAIAIGVVVDDAIIGLENVWRRLRESRERRDSRSIFSIVLDATIEVRSPIVYATFIVAAVFIPVLMMSGINGRLFAPLGVAFLLAIFASLIVAVTLTPALCYLLLPRVRMVEPPYIGWLKHQHRRALDAIARHARWVIAAAAVLCVAAVVVLPFLGGEFLPEFHEGHYVIRMTLAPGSSLSASLRAGAAISEQLLKDPDILSVSQEAGRAEQGEDTEGPEYSELHVELRRHLTSSEDEVKERIRKVLAAYPGVTSSVTTFLSMRIDEILSGASGEFVVKLLGNDLGQLDTTAEKVRRIIASVPGATDVYLAAQTGSPQLTVRLRQERLEQFGFRPVDVLDAVETAYQGTTVSQVYQGNRAFDVTVLLDSASRRNPEAVGSLLVQNASGLRLPLRELADVVLGSGRYVIDHEGTLRRRQVTCDVEGRDMASFASAVRRRLAAQLALPPGVTLVVGGEAEAQAVAQRELILHSIAAAVIIVLLLSLVFQNTRNTLLVLANLPFALTGGVLAVLLSGGALSIGSLVGFISLFGISARNSILLISHYEELVSREGLVWGAETAARGATERLVPILMTALVVALGLLPIALHSGEAGKEIEGPMAIVILGGLITSTALNLLVLPALAQRFGRFERLSEPPSARANDVPAR
ncbi:MAG TPA: efflux RND transporter permease subunit [Steroidobacteraceae bacterium]|nr:efflux RND transporter permease subunit [Steroidobacteraceae bacterium]